VIKRVLNVSQAMHRAFANATKFTDQWRDYDTKYQLWNQKKWANVDRVKDKKRSIVYFDDRLSMDFTIIGSSFSRCVFVRVCVLVCVCAWNYVSLSVRVCESVYL